MKTITTFIISLTLFILSIAVIFYSINTFKYISTTFYNQGATDTYSFSFTFVLASVISFIFAIILIIKAIHYYSIHRKYYHSYMLNKRDREIKDKVENAKYNQLYEDLRDSPTVELKEAVLNTFYSTKNIAKQADNSRTKGIIMSKSIKSMLEDNFKPIDTNQEDFDAMIRGGLKEESSKPSRADWADMDDKPRKKGLLAYMDESTTAKPLRKIPTPHNLMGFEDIIFDKVDNK